MKSKVITLTKVFLKNSFQKMKDQTGTNQSKKSKSMILLYGFVFLYLAGIVSFFSYQMIGTLMRCAARTSFFRIDFPYHYGIFTNSIHFFYH